MTIPPLTNLSPVKPRIGAERQQTYYRTDKGKLAEWRRQQKDYMTRPFIAWDGEGITRDDGRHVYNLLANSLGDSLIDRTGDGLNTWEIFDFVYDVTRGIDGINILYGASYDWNMWIANLNRYECERLYKTTRLYVGDWRIIWKANKNFAITYRPKKNGERKDIGRVGFYDLYPFFHSTFVDACDSYLGNRFIDRDKIIAGKAGRSTFTADDLELVADYNVSELKNLVLLATELRDRLNRVDIRPSQWYGPGAIAAALLKRHHVKDAMAECPDEVNLAAQYAYAGGRFETIKCGVMDKRGYNSWQYDINSAYPYALTKLPDLANGSWVHHTNNVKPPTGIDNSFTVYRLRYTADANDITTDPGIPWDTAIHPFFCRMPKGSVVFPRWVEGWYWAPEVYAGINYAKRFGYHVSLLESWEFVPHTGAGKPFAFINDLFKQREALKIAGDGAHVVIKGGMNSIYGKLIQQIGYYETDDGAVQKPPYHQLEWGGYITSHCRASILQILLDNDATEDVIAFETDAVFVTRKLEKIPEGTGLGQWETTIYSWLCYCQSGFYFGRSGQKLINKTRGMDKGIVFFNRENDPSDMADKAKHVYVQEAYSIPMSQFPWKQIDINQPSTFRHIVAPLTRFVGVGLALQGDWSQWRRWVRSDKTIAITPTSGKRIHKLCKACVRRGKHLGFAENVWHTASLPLFPKRPISKVFPIEWMPNQPDMPEIEESREDWKRMESFNE